MELGPVTLVLMGRTGNGKSATGNTILGEKAFKSGKSLLGITISSEMKSSLRQDGRVVNVIDTPGIFHLSSGTDYITREIVKCIDLASNGIHAVLLVFSVKNRFSPDEEATVKTLQNLFGFKILEYAIVVFTGGDEFDDDDDDITFEDYLHECPVALKDILAACKNRCVVFDNKTKSELKKEEQVSKLLGLVDEMIAKNGGQLYNSCFISKFKLEKEFNGVKRKLEKEFDEVKSKLEQSYLYNNPEVPKEEWIKLMSNLNENFERQVEEEREACRKVEGRLEEVESQYRDEIEKLTEELRIVLVRTARLKAEVEESHQAVRQCHIL